MTNIIVNNFFIVCETAFTDKASGNLSIINIFENINSASFPAMHPKFTAIVNFSVPKPKEIHCFVVLKDPKGVDMLKSQEYIVTTTMENQKVQILNGFVGTVFKEPGTHRITLLVNDEEIASTELFVKKT